MTRRIAHSALAVVVGAAAVITAACGSGSAADTKGSVLIVTSTDVYGDLAEQIAGDLSGSKITITSIISDPAQDPHSYEASTKDRLSFSKARIVIENGGGYDDFATKMLAASHSKAAVINAVDISGKKRTGGELNEHVWYDLPTVLAVVGRISDALAAADRADTSTFQANARALTTKIAALQQQEAALKAAHAGVGVAITEPVPLYLLEACGLVNRTPAAFSAAVEAGTDVSPRVLRQTLQLFSQRQVQALVYNAQTSGPETQRVLDAARRNHIAAVPVTETLPEGKDFVEWMTDNLAAVRKSLG